MHLRGMLRAIEGIIVGTILYVPLLLLPMIGPLLAGLAAGRTAESSPGKGLILGLFCGIAGSIIWLFSILPGWKITPEWFYWIVWAVFLLWNLLSILLCAFGGLMGSMVAASREAFSRIPKNGTGQETKIDPEHQAPTYVVCRSCGTSNPEEASSCGSCSEPLTD